MTCSIQQHFCNMVLSVDHASASGGMHTNYSIFGCMEGHADSDAAALPSGNFELTTDDHKQLTQSDLKKSGYVRLETESGLIQL